VVTNSLSSIDTLLATIQDDERSPLVFASVCIDVLKNVSQFAAFTGGPQGESAAVFIDGICSIIGTALGMAIPEKPTPLAMAMTDLKDYISAEFDNLERIITKLGQDIEFGFERQEYHSILLEAKETIGIIGENTSQLTDRLNHFSVLDQPFDSVTEQAIQSIPRDNGVGPLAGLRSYVERQVGKGIFLLNGYPSKLSGEGRNEVGNFTCTVIYLHTQIAIFRKLELMQLKFCYMWQSWSTW
jgi:hypothetical protein